MHVRRPRISLEVLLFDVSAIVGGLRRCCWRALRSADHWGRSAPGQTVQSVTRIGRWVRAWPLSYAPRAVGAREVADAVTGHGHLATRDRQEKGLMSSSITPEAGKSEAREPMSDPGRR